MNTIQMIALGLLIAGLLAMQAMAAAPTWDPSYPSKYLYERALYRGDALSVPEASSSGQKVMISNKLGETFPTTVMTPIFGGRLTGYATLDNLPKNKYVSKQTKYVATQQKVRTPTNKELPKANKELKRGFVSTTQISGTLKGFPTTPMTKIFNGNGRWIGPAKDYTQLKK